MTKMDVATQLCPDPKTLRALIAEGPSPAAAAALAAGRTPVTVEVIRVHFPATKPMQVMLRAEGDSGLLIGEWVGPSAATRAQAESARLSKPRRGQSDGGQAPAVVADPCSGLVLRRPGFDAKLPGLRLLHDPAWAADQLQRVGLDPASDIRLVSHRLGKRAVLKITGRTGTQYARLRPVTSGSGEAAYQRHHALWSALDGTTGLTIPRPLGFVAEAGLALFAALPGSPPVFRGLSGYRATRDIMRALGGLQGLAIDADRHDARDELAILDSWAERLRNVFPEVARRLRDPLARLAKDLLALPECDRVPCHRDLHEGQILLHGDGVGLLDFDTLRLGDPALDVGNLQAHLILAGLMDGRSYRAFLTAMDTALPHLPLKRIGIWRRAALLRLAIFLTK
ncbi:phosphotransferase family protein [Aphanothece microscopica]|uniref:phosphotransferase family protein n=1 Tax=Aphanothece microscopica TaxID=1049561 RepID=UPI0039850683